jgi:modulator of FtsH protease
MDAAYDPGAWRDFGVALVSASAALLGLIFVVVSLHLRAVVDDPVLRRRAEVMLGLLAMTLAASAAMVLPGQSREALGLELMPIELVCIGLSSLVTFRATYSPRGVSRDRLSAMLAIWILFVGLGIEQRNS